MKKTFLVFVLCLDKSLPLTEEDHILSTKYSSQDGSTITRQHTGNSISLTTRFLTSHHRVQPWLKEDYRLVLVANTILRSTIRHVSIPSPTLEHLASLDNADTANGIRSIILCFEYLSGTMHDVMLIMFVSM